MEKYNLLLQIKPPHMQSKYLTEMVNRSDIIFTHKTLDLEFKKEKKILQEKIDLGEKQKAEKAKKKGKGKRGGANITLVF